MCIGPEIAALVSAAAPAMLAAVPGTAMAAAGALYNNQIQNDAIQAQNEQTQRVIEMQQMAQDSERARQEAWANQQATRTMDAAAFVDPTTTAERIAADVAAPDNAIVSAADNYNLPTLQGQIADSPSGEQIGKSVADAVSRATDLLTAYSTMSAGRTQMGANQDELVRMGTENALIGSQRSNSAQVAGQEAMLPVPTVTPADSIFGDLLLLGGQALAGIGGKTVGGRAPVPTRTMSPMMTNADVFGQPLVW